MTATITRYKLVTRHGKFSWKWGYTGHLNGQKFLWGDHSLAGLREYLKRQGATSVVEAWKTPSA